MSEDTVTVLVGEVKSLKSQIGMIKATLKPLANWALALEPDKLSQIIAGVEALNQAEAMTHPAIPHPTAATLQETARHFGVSPSEVADWASRGAPVRYLAYDGHGRSYLDRSFFNVYALEAWRQTENAENADLEAKRAQLLAQDRMQR